MLPWPGPLDSISSWESYWAQVAILRNLPHGAKSVPLQNSIEMQGDFPTLTQNLQYQLATLWTASHTPDLGYLYSHWSLPLSLRILIAPRIKKQRTWLAATPTAGNEKQGKMGWDLSYKLWKGDLCKATPRTERGKSRYPQQDVRGPCRETAVPSPLSTSDKQKRRKYEKPAYGKGGKLSDLKSWGNSTSRACFRSWALYQHPLYPLKELQGNQESESLTSHFQAHRT